MSCPCGHVCTGCTESEFDAAICCVDRCGLDFVLHEFGLPVSPSDLELQLSMKLAGHRLESLTCDALTDSGAGASSNCTTDLADGAQCQVGCPNIETIAVGFFHCIDGMTVGASECLFIGGNLTVQTMNAFASSILVTVESTASGVDASQADQIQEVLTAMFGVDASDFLKVSVTQDPGVARRVGASQSESNHERELPAEMPRRATPGTFNVLIAYQLVVSSPSATDALLVLAASPQSALQAAFLSVLNVSVAAVSVQVTPKLFTTTVGNQVTTQTTLTSISMTESSTTVTDTTATADPDADVSGLNNLSENTVFLIMSLGGMAIVMFCMLLVAMVFWRIFEQKAHEDKTEEIDEAESPPPSEPDIELPYSTGFLGAAVERVEGDKGEPIDDVPPVCEDHPRNDIYSDSDSVSSEMGAFTSGGGIAMPRLRLASVCSHASSSSSKSAVARHNKIPEPWEEASQPIGMIGMTDGRRGRPPTASEMDYQTDSSMFSAAV